MPWLAILLLAARGWATGAARLEAGRELFGAACSACHGADGRGNPQWDSAVPPQDLADCATTAERGDHWESIVARGGKPFGLSSVMPAFGETLNQDEIAGVVAYTRTLCSAADRYPPGELNPRRVLSTRKAFPESDVVLRADQAIDRSRRAMLHVELERRVGARFQVSVGLPFRPQNSIYDDLWGPGNVELGVKRVIAFSPSRGLISSLGLELEFPTGNYNRNLGTNTWVWKPYAAVSKSGGRTAAQAHVLAELPDDSFRWQDRQILYGGAVSYALGPPRLAWTPSVGIVGTVNRRRHFWRHELVFEISRPISRLGHVVAGIGVRVPTGRSEQLPARVEAFFSWDRSEGPPWRGF